MRETNPQYIAVTLRNQNTRDEGWLKWRALLPFITTLWASFLAKKEFFNLKVTGRSAFIPMLALFTHSCRETGRRVMPLRHVMQRLVSSAAVSYLQGQSPSPKVREYFYYIDHQGQVITTHDHSFCCMSVVFPQLNVLPPRSNPAGGGGNGY